MFVYSRNNMNIPFVDDWIVNDNFIQFVRIGNRAYFKIPYISAALNLDQSEAVSLFDLRKKRAYYGDGFVESLIRYVNYFITYFDNENFLLEGYKNMKVLIDSKEHYPIEDFHKDMVEHILNPVILTKINIFNEYNSQIIKVSSSKHIHESLRYEKNHLKILHELSMLFRISIPLLSHYAFIHSEEYETVNKFLNQFYITKLFNMYDIDIIRKLISTVENKTSKSKKTNEILWEKQSIQGINENIYTLHNLGDIITCILPKACYKQNIYSFIDVASRTNTENFIVKRIYPMAFRKDMPISAINEFDVYTRSCSNTSEALHIYENANCKLTNQRLFSQFPDIDEELILAFEKELADEEGNVIQPFQERIILTMLYKHYGDTISIKNCNTREYIRLMLIAKEILSSHKLGLLSEIVTSKTITTSTRKDLNKKEKSLLENSELYSQVMYKYNNSEKAVDELRSMIATAISSVFRIIDPRSPLKDHDIPIHPMVIVYELLSWCILI